MTFQIQFFNIWALIVCFILNMLIGSFWYSSILFGNIWLKLTTLKKENITNESANKAMMLSIIPALVSIILLWLILAFADASTIADAIIIGSLVSAGFIGMSALNLVLFEGRPFALALLNTGYSFVSMNVAAVILTLWR